MTTLKYLKQSFGIKQLVKRPTRAKVVLDKVYTNMYDYYDEPTMTTPLGLSDHNCVVCYPNGVTSKTKPKVMTRRVRICDPSYKANDHPWVTDRFKLLVQKKQNAWHSGQNDLYRNVCRNTTIKSKQQK